MIRFDQTGDSVSETIGGFRVAAADIKGAARKNTEDFAWQVRNRMVGMLMGGNFDVAPVGENYAPRKVRIYGIKPVLVASETYVQAITVVNDGSNFRVGFEDGARAANGEPLSRVAASLEFGTSTMPGRPHWRPTVEYAQSNAPKVGRRTIADLKLVK